MNSETKTKLKQLIVTVFGICFLGMGVAFVTVPELGNEPLEAFNESLSHVLGITLGQMTSLTELIMIGICLLLNRSSIGFGTILSMFLVQFPIDAVMSMLGRPENVFLAYGMIVFGTVLIAIGAELIVAAKLGMGPYEAFLHTVAKLLKIRFSRSKYLCDGTFLLLAASMKGNVGIGTIIVFVLCPKLMELFGNILEEIISF